MIYVFMHLIYKENTVDFNFQCDFVNPVPVSYNIL